MKNKECLNLLFSGFLLLVIGGCGDSSSETSDLISDEVSEVDDVEETTDEDTEEDQDSNWIINNINTSTYILDDNGDGVVEDVQSAETVTDRGIEYTYVLTNGIPKYDMTMTDKMVENLDDRPKAETDFVDGYTTVAAGDLVLFGQDIGYNSSSENCDDTGGAGYWPPGPGCPYQQSVEAYFIDTPTDLDDSEVCETGLNSIGLMVNGVAIFNWGDGMTYSTNQWYNLAPEAEQYDVDICAGHAANGLYHHHQYTSCLAELVGDEGDQHSPIYGFAADGYPLYGPYESAGELAVSGWKVRDYGASEAEGGCDTEGQRTCVLVDEYDLDAGVTEVEENGPDIGEDVTTLSDNVIAADNGYYYEDYYYADEEVTGAVLDEHNGHDTGDGKGYHYHITLTEDDDGTLSPSFPYQMGPRFKGELPDNSFATCDTSTDTVVGGFPAR
ncbi:YHYH protein [Psychromonas sp.]|uniref:YHYH protein n=1 Tax=Psychromonas sp. TaxID=1884585 RepID=UPI003A96EAA1